jgi:hypothetical protein
MGNRISLATLNSAKCRAGFLSLASFTKLFENYLYIR